MEKVSHVDTVTAFNLLSSLYIEATRGKIPQPGHLLSGVRRFPNGSELKISRVGHRLGVAITERDGAHLHVVLDQDGLSSIYFTGARDKRLDIKLDDLDGTTKQGEFRETVKDLVPWFIERYMSEKAKPLPAGLIERFRSLTTSRS